MRYWPGKYATEEDMRWAEAVYALAIPSTSSLLPVNGLVKYDHKTWERGTVVENEKFQELVLQQLQALAEGQKQLFEGQKQLSERLGLVEEGQARLENRIEALDNRMEVLENRLDSLGNRMEVLENRMESVENRMEALENRMDSLENRQAKLELRLENEVIPKISALFDGYQLRGDQIENLKQYFDERLDAIALDINFLIGRVVRHDTAIRELRRAR